MSASPVICFGQQPNGFFPKRFFYAKVLTARRLQAEMGGRIVYFCHDSDHDPRETKTILHHVRINETIELNFTFANKIQRKFSPMHLKRVQPDWKAKTAIQLPAYVDHRWVELFNANSASNVADFCLEMYRGMGLLEGIELQRSSDPAFRRAACDISDYFVDVPYEGEIVRARETAGELSLHEGGNAFIKLPRFEFTKEQISPTRDSRLLWMQSVIHCTHYIAGAGEQHYLRKEEAPEITFLNRDPIERIDDAYTEIPA
jgi:hypothetical protein